jgi:hypothetical protein
MTCLICIGAGMAIVTVPAALFCLYVCAWGG